MDSMPEQNCKDITPTADFSHQQLNYRYLQT